MLCDLPSGNIKKIDAGKRPGFAHLIIANFCYASIIICMTYFSTASASPDVEDIRVAALTESHTKVLNNKPDTSCEAPDASQKKKLSLIRSCTASLLTIDKLRLLKDFSFVDVRSSAEYDRYHITGSINIPLHQVKTKEFLKKMSVVLVNDGRSTADLEKTCVDLKQVGFDHVTVLEGGLFAWRANKRPLEGDPLAQAKLNRMSADEMIEERKKPNLYVIDVSTTGKHKDLNAWLPAKIIVIQSKSKKDSIARINSTITQQRKLNPLSRPILIADDDNGYERFDASLQKTGMAIGMLRLEGGINGYREYVTRQLDLWSEENKPRRYEACKG